MPQILIANSLAQTKKIATQLAKFIRAAPSQKNALVIGLEGELGSGKTSFVQGFARGLGIREKVLSPTFVMIKRYKIPETQYRMQNLYHVDCYRIKTPQEIVQLGWKEIVSNPSNTIVVEWAERIKKILPKNILWIRFETTNHARRKITVIGPVDTRSNDDLRNSIHRTPHSRIFQYKK